MARYLLQYWVCCLLPVCLLAADPCLTWHGATFVEDRCLLGSVDELSWVQATAACVALGGRLAEPKTGPDLSRLTDFLKSTTWSTAWVGSNWRPNVSDFRWLSDDTEVDVTLWGSRQQPSGHATRENCVMLKVRDSLHHSDCQVLSGYVCERVITDPCEESLPGGRYILGYCFKLMSVSSTWPEAKNSCETMNAFLAETKTSALLDGVIDYTKTATNPYVWLGGSDEVQEGVFKWVTSGEVFGLGINRRWHQGEPDGRRTQDHVALDAHGQNFGLVDQHESQHFFYVCQAEPTPIMSYIHIVVIPKMTNSPALQERIVTVTTGVASRDVNVRITAYDRSTVLFSQDQVLSDSRPVFLSLPASLELSQTGIHQKYVMIESSAPVTVILWYWGESGAGSTLIYNSQWLSDMPETGLSYFLPASSIAHRSASHLTVVAMNSGETNVTFYFRSRERSMDFDFSYIIYRQITQANAKLTDKYEAAHIQSYLGSAEVFIHASQPVAVFLSNADAEFNSGYGDYVIENILPIEFLDSDYVTFPTLPLSGDNRDQNLFLLVAVYDNTTFKIVTADGNIIELPPLSSGQVRSLFLPSTDACHIRGSQSFYVYKLSAGRNDSTVASPRQPCMTSLLPRHLWHTQYDFFVPFKMLGFQMFVVVVADTKWIGQLSDTLQQQNSSCGLVGDMNLSWCYYNITDNISIYNHIHLEDHRATFAAYLYAFDENSTVCHGLGISTSADASPVFDYELYLKLHQVTETPAYCENETTSVSINTTTEYMVTDVTNATTTITTADFTSTTTTSTTSTSVATTSPTDPVTQSTTTATTMESTTTATTTESTTAESTTTTATTDTSTTAATTTSIDDAPTIRAINIISNLSSEEIQHLIGVIHKHLYLDARSTSTFRRTKMSIPDLRPSSQAIGLVAITFLVLAIAVLSLSDMTKLIFYLVEHCRGKGTERE